MNVKYDEQVLLFVYGTLKKGQPNHARLNGAQFVDHATLNAELYHHNDTIAVVVESRDPWARVHGEVYLVSPATLEVIDSFEGHPNFYERRTMTAKFKRSKIEQDVFVYMFDRCSVSIDDVRVISGKWDANTEYRNFSLVSE